MNYTHIKIKNIFQLCPKLKNLKILLISQDSSKSIIYVKHILYDPIALNVFIVLLLTDTFMIYVFIVELLYTSHYNISIIYIYRPIYFQ